MHEENEKLLDTKLNNSNNQVMCLVCVLCAERCVCLCVCVEYKNIACRFVAQKPQLHCNVFQVASIFHSTNISFTSFSLSLSLAVASVVVVAPLPGLLLLPYYCFALFHINFFSSVARISRVRLRYYSSFARCVACCGCLCAFF